MKLNSRQTEAIKNVSGPCLVLAGAGSGKTGVITKKIEYLVQHCGYNPNEIAALTFTNKAAKEMKEAISKSGVDFWGVSFSCNKKCFRCRTKMRVSSFESSDLEKHFS